MGFLTWIVVLFAVLFVLLFASGVGLWRFFDRKYRVVPDRRAVPWWWAFEVNDEADLYRRLCRAMFNYRALTGLTDRDDWAFELAGNIRRSQHLEGQPWLLAQQALKAKVNEFEMSVSSASLESILQTTSISEKVVALQLARQELDELEARSSLKALEVETLTRSLPKPDEQPEELPVARPVPLSSPTADTPLS